MTPDSGRVKRGKTVKLAMLDQQAGILADVEDQMVREVLAQLQTDFQVDGKDITPTALLERLGFRREHLSARVQELSGGQRRRLQLMLTILSEPNVLILDEPTNDVDTDMLAATEDLLDSWPGTLIVVSHDRYLLERVTDQQYAILDGHLRHLPGGVEEYLRLAAARPQGEHRPAQSAQSTQPNPPCPAPSCADWKRKCRRSTDNWPRSTARSGPSTISWPRMSNPTTRGSPG